MASLEDIAISGLLTEGNFMTWKVRMEAILRVHGFKNVNNLLDIQPNGGHSQVNAARIIRNHVSPELLKGVRTEAENRAAELVKELERLAFRFRFMDLPAELRNQIYNIVLRDRPHVTIAPLRRWSSRYPAITEVSRQLREEAMPVFYECTMIEFDFSGLLGAKPHAHVADAVCSWARKQTTSYLKHISQIKLTLSSRNFIEYSYTTPGGLTVRWSSTFPQSMADWLLRKTSIMEKTRKALGMQGDSVVMAAASVFGSS